MIVASSTLALPAGTVSLLVSDSGQFAFYACFLQPPNHIFLNFTGSIVELPLVAEGLQLCFRSLPPGLLANIATTPPQNPDKAD